MSGRHYCTYFDHRYLSKGLTLYSSLRRHGGELTLWVLCLSNECEAALRDLALPGLRTLTLPDLERFDPELVASRQGRSAIEYYFTCSPCLPRYVLSLAPEANEITYLDSDLYFFADPAIVFEELGQFSVGITPHRFTPRARASHGQYGAYNVGWVSFRQDANGLACMNWWRQQCIEWCFDRLEGDRYADQKYLDQFERRFEGVKAIHHPGVNLAPWNLGQYEVELIENVVTVGSRPLVLFHFQGLRRVGAMRFDTNLTGYGERLNASLRELIFLPYLRELVAWESRLHELGHATFEPGLRRRAAGARAAWNWSKQRIALVRSALAGNVITLE
jgi:hypothetical protein